MSAPSESHNEPVSIAIRIGRARPTLTRSHQQMADYVMAHPLQAATMPIDELAAAVGVSVATANRFARAIGLDGYPMLRAELVKGFEAMLAPIEKMRIRVEKPSSMQDVFAAALEESQRNIAATREALDGKACEEAVRVILAARYGTAAALSSILTLTTIVSLMIFFKLTGGKELALELEEKGYDWITKRHDKQQERENKEAMIEDQDKKITKQEV